MKKGSNLIIVFAVFGLLVGVFYAKDQVFPSVAWLERVIAALTVVSVLSSTVLEFIAAKTREKTGSVTSTIQDTLNDTKNAMLRSFKQVQYEEDKKFNRMMLQHNNNQLPSFWHFKLRFEEQNRLLIIVNNPETHAIYDYEIQIRGIHEMDIGEFKETIYIASIVSSPTQNLQSAPFKVGDQVACFYENGKYNVSHYIQDARGGHPKFDFRIYGVPGQTKSDATGILASGASIQPRLKDEI